MNKLILLPFLFVTVLLAPACSKCYDCKTTVSIEDSNGNVISTEERSEEVCTASDDEIDNKEADGYDCS